MSQGFGVYSQATKLAHWVREYPQEILRPLSPNIIQRPEQLNQITKTGTQVYTGVAKKIPGGQSNHSMVISCREGTRRVSAFHPWLPPYHIPHHRAPADKPDTYTVIVEKNNSHHVYSNIFFTGM